MTLSEIVEKAMEQQQVLNWKGVKVNSIKRRGLPGRQASKTLSAKWDAEEFDPFQVFQVEHEACLDLEITVCRGEGITKGNFIKDFMDVPDPYIILKIPGSSNSSKRTSHLDNTTNPEWDETFHFYLDPNKKDLVLMVSLMDANYAIDEALGDDTLSLSELKEDEEKEYIFHFLGGSKIFTKIKLQKNKVPDLRFSLSLCENEKNFLRHRRENVRAAMKKMLREKGPVDKYEVPIVAVLGSGGGFRAMICFSGVIKALYESGILGCSTFISGLSGSSWLISTLYAHDKFPDLTFDEVYEELCESVTNDWKKKLFYSFSYAKDILSKYRNGQPVSFTDFFGHLLGDVLLKGKKEKKLSDQQRIVATGKVPFPLYTCLHAKAAVSCRTFSEWVEFSPFEIGIAKYGTFMKTEHFGNKFIVGKLIKRFPEFPLHYLQGVWGSAFTILIKRLLAGETTANQDMVQLMRNSQEERLINEQLEDEGLYLSSEDAEVASDTDDETDIVGKDDGTLSPSGQDQVEEFRELTNAFDNCDIDPKEEYAKQDEEEEKIDTFNISYSSKQTHKNAKSNKNGKGKSMFKMPFSFDTIKNELKKDKTVNQERDDLSVINKKSTSLDESAKMTKPHFSIFSKTKEDQRKISTQSDPGIGGFHPIRTNQQARKARLKRQEKITSGSANHWAKIREERMSKRENNKSGMIQSFLSNSNILNSRVGRAGEILNPFRGLSLRHSFPLSPFTDALEESDNDYPIDEMDVGPQCRYEPLDNTAKKLFIVDSGLAFNSPYPLLLRPQRAVDIYLSFDFSQRSSDKAMPFKELIIAEKWARQNSAPFPPVEKLAKEFSKDAEVKEIYVFKDPDDKTCPIILHFPLVNNKFKRFKSPGVERNTKEELDFADFPIFDDVNSSFASTNFVYERIQYERLVKLMEFNTLLCLDTIKDTFAEVIERKREMIPKVTRATFSKLQQTLKAVNKFKKCREGLQIKIDKEEGQKILNSISHDSIKRARTISGQSNASSEYEDAVEYLYDHTLMEEEESEPNAAVEMASENKSYHTKGSL